MERQPAAESERTRGGEPGDPLLRIRLRVKSIGGLPTLPAIARQILQIANDPSSSMADMAHIIERDPALASRVLKVANSAFYGLSRKVGSLNLALVLLGMKKASHLVAGISIFRALEEKLRGDAIPREAFWAHSVAVSRTATALATRLEIRCDGEELVAGLLHDIGKIVIDLCFPADFVEILHAAGPRGESGCAAERRILGVDHARIGRWVAEKWNLPEAICEAIGLHHGDAEVLSHKPLVAILQTANAIAKVRSPGIASGPAPTDEEILGLPLLRDREEEAARALFEELASGGAGGDRVFLDARRL